MSLFHLVFDGSIDFHFFALLGRDVWYSEVLWFPGPVFKFGHQFPRKS
jgi:hypothetical protein